MEDIRVQVHTCFHCGNTGLLKYIGKTVWKNEVLDRDEEGNLFTVLPLEDKIWHIFECPVCNSPVIISEYIEYIQYSECEYRPAYPMRTTEYPTIAISADGVPEEIYSAFESAVKTRGIDHAICLLSLRRVLEMICKDKGETKGKLAEKVNALVDKKILPPMIGDACWIIREMGNAGAHADNINVYASDIEQVIAFVSAIIDYLYSLPHRVEKMKKRIEKREVD